MKKGSLSQAIAGTRTHKRQHLANTKKLMTLSDLKDRPHGDARPLNEDHVGELVESIAAIGLIQPIAVDREGHLLAGGHRKAALQVLEQTNKERYQKLFASGVPVRVFEFNAQDDHDKAIAIEAAENEKRRDYTPAEVRELAKKLVGAGYRDKQGKPKVGEKPLLPALMTIVGKSRATVKRYLADSDQKGSNEPFSDTKRQKLLKRAVSALDAMQNSEEFDDDELKVLRRALRHCQRLQEA